MSTKIGKKIGTAGRAGQALSSRREAKPSAGTFKTVPARVRKGVDVAIDLYKSALKELEKY